MTGSLLGNWADLGGIAAIAASVRAGHLDPVLLAQRALRRADERARLGAVVHLDRDGALDAAAAAGRARAGALAGVPVLVKEIIAVARLPWTCGSDVRADCVAAADAAVVHRVRAAGGVIIGLCHSHEFAYGCTGTVNRAGPCRNPHDPERMTGGSSSGAAAAVAAGVVPLALGTDTAGSVRIPAALCGVVGAKPARDTLPTDGVFPLAGSLDHVGVLTGSVADARYTVGVLAGDTGQAVLPVGAPRLGLLAVEDPSPAVATAFSSAVATLTAAGADVVDVSLPEWDAIGATLADLQGPEAAAIHADAMAGRAEDYQPDVRDRLRLAAEVPGWRYVRARSRVAELTSAIDGLLNSVDAVLLPTVPIVAPSLDTTDVELPTGRVPVRAALLRYTRAVNVTGHPAISLPLSPAGLPVGLQVVATDNQKAFAVAEWVAAAVERGAR